MARADVCQYAKIVFSRNNGNIFSILLFKGNDPPVQSVCLLKRLIH